MEPLVCESLGIPIMHEADEAVAEDAVGIAMNRCKEPTGKWCNVIISRNNNGIAVAFEDAFELGSSRCGKNLLKTEDGYLFFAHPCCDFFNGTTNPG